ncbi:MAG: polysaccharide biosynthesis protein [Lachnospiraceae bacterium]|jgi:O-antigen/teichoic acid export membrane protein|nr:polysaccharide biosynthesis protein [Lachnospiraceae bacterium]
MGRVQAAVKNIAFGQAGNLITQILNFVLRTLFIRHLGDTLNGVNGLYTNVLSVLSMAELGIGTALNYSLYKPVARKDIEKIKSYMLLYKQAYRVIGIVVAVIGIACAPFLPYIVKASEGIPVRDLTLYYLIFLFNTVSTYFVSYKYSLINAEQKNYIQTNIITVTKMITVVLQMAVILATGSFYAYLLTAAGVELLQKIFVSRYLDRRYPYLKDRDVRKLSGEETAEIVTKTKALVFHKVGDVARLQTDSMIITGFISAAVSSFVDNYNMVLNSVANVVNIIFNSVLSSFGNLFATESRQKQYQIFKVYRFAACWIYGFSAMGFSLLLTPLIELWLGEERTLAFSVVICILIDYYFKGDRIVLSNFKTAAGVFEQDKYLALIQGGVNLVISIALVRRIGLVGVYVGTIVSGLIANVTKPVIIYRVILDRPVREYFIDSAKYLITLLGTFGLLSAVKALVMRSVTIASFAVMFVVICAAFNGIFLFLFGRTEEFRYLLNLLTGKLGRILGGKG